MNNIDDEKGGKYHGSFAWPGGVPIVSAKEVDDIKKMQPIREAVKKEVKKALIYLIINELPTFNFTAVEKTASDMAS